MRQPLFSVIVPFYQNELNVPHTLSRLLKLPELAPDYRFEFVFVEDGSRDRTYELLYQQTKLTNYDIKLIKLTKNFGQIAAIRAGLAQASGDCMGIISADLQDPPEMFIEMLKRWREGFRLVIAERTERDEGPIQTALSSIYWKMVQRFALPKYPSGGFDFCIVDKLIAQNITALPERNTQIFPLIFSLGYSFTTLKYRREKRVHGTSQWTFTMKLKLFLDTFIAFSYLPIRCISVIGFLVALFSMFYGLYMTIMHIFYGNIFTGWTTLVVLISTLGGTTLITLGIIGEYLWRILDQVRSRPLFVIEEIAKSKN